MRRIASCLVLALLLAGCASSAEKARMKTLYDKYDTHCREHAREVQTEVDEELRYRECMQYFVATDIHCPHCAVDKHMHK